MPRSLSRAVLSGALGAALVAAATPARAQVVDDFESYLLGALPAPLWSDAGAVLPTPPIPPFPSAFVFATTDAHGNPTKAVTTVGDLATSKGIFTAVPVGTLYSLHADTRVDRYSDAPSSTTSDWAMQITFGQNGVDNWAYTPQAGIYASSLTGGWRLYVSIASTFADIDLGVPATVGTWYTVDQTLDVALGQFRSRILDAATGTVLVDQTNTIVGWNPADAHFDAFAFFGGDLSTADHVGNVGVVDNVNVVTATPEGSSLALLAGGAAPLLAWRLRRRRR